MRSNLNLNDFRIETKRNGLFRWIATNIKWKVHYKHQICQNNRNDFNLFKSWNNFPSFIGALSF